MLLRVLLDGLVEEEVGGEHADAVPLFAARGQDVLQLLEDAVGGHAPGLGQLERDDIGVPAADGRGPLPARLIGELIAGTC